MFTTLGYASAAIGSIFLGTYGVGKISDSNHKKYELMNDITDANQIDRVTSDKQRIVLANLNCGWFFVDLFEKMIVNHTVHDAGVAVTTKYNEKTHTTTIKSVPVIIQRNEQRIEFTDKPLMTLYKPNFVFKTPNDIELIISNPFTNLFNRNTINEQIIREGDEMEKELEKQDSSFKYRLQRGSTYKYNKYTPNMMFCLGNRSSSTFLTNAISDNKETLAEFATSDERLLGTLLLVMGVIGCGTFTTATYLSLNQKQK